MKVEIWSDVVCPWCYIGKRRFESALGQFAHRDEVEVEWRSFELDPSATSVSVPGDGPGHAELIAAKYGMSLAQAEEAVASVTRAAAGEGLAFHLDRSLRSNTFDAHRLIHLGADRGLQGEAKERFMRAYFTEGEPVGDPETLVRLVVDAGLDREDVEGVLAGDEYADAVRSDEAEARALGISGVPFFVVDRKFGVSGAQPADQLLAVLERAWSERSPLTLVGAGQEASDEACGPDGCPVGGRAEGVGGSCHHRLVASRRLAALPHEARPRVTAGLCCGALLSSERGRSAHAYRSRKQCGRVRPPARAHRVLHARRRGPAG
jgi:predicted DsbA family dithiol-disulfide isomerase